MNSLQRSEKPILVCLLLIFFFLIWMCYFFMGIIKFMLNQFLKNFNETFVIIISNIDDIKVFYKII